MKALRAFKEPLPTPKAEVQISLEMKWQPSEYAACQWPVNLPEVTGWSWSVREAHQVEKLGKECQWTRVDPQKADC